MTILLKRGDRLRAKADPIVQDMLDQGWVPEYNRSKTAYKWVNAKTGEDYIGNTEAGLDVDKQGIFQSRRGVKRYAGKLVDEYMNDGTIAEYKQKNAPQGAPSSPYVSNFKGTINNVQPQVRLNYPVSTTYAPLQWTPPKATTTEDEVVVDEHVGDPNWKDGHYVGKTDKAGEGKTKVETSKEEGQKKTAGGIPITVTGGKARNKKTQRLIPITPKSPTLGETTLWNPLANIIWRSTGVVYQGLAGRESSRAYNKWLNETRLPEWTDNLNLNENFYVK